MISRLPISALPLLALAACSSEPGTPTPAATDSQASADAEVPALATAPAGTADASNAAPAETTIPAGMRGRWGMVAADCETGRDDAKGLMTVSPTSLRFYESVGKLKTVARGDAESLAGTFAYEGEGMAWTRDITLTLKDGGKTLILVEKGDDAPAGPQIRTRCN